MAGEEEMKTKAVAKVSPRHEEDDLQRYIESQPKLKAYLKRQKKNFPFPRHFDFLEKESYSLSAMLWRELEWVWGHQRDEKESTKDRADAAIGHLANTLRLCEGMMGLLWYSYHLLSHAMKTGDSLEGIEKEVGVMETEFKTHKPMWDFLDHKLADEVDREERGKKNPAIR